MRYEDRYDVFGEPITILQNQDRPQIIEMPGHSLEDRLKTEIEQAHEWLDAYDLARANEPEAPRPNPRPWLACVDVKNRRLEALNCIAPVLSDAATAHIANLISIHSVVEATGYDTKRVANGVEVVHG